LNTFIHPKSEVLTKKIGQNSIIWQFAVIMEDVTIGKSLRLIEFGIEEG
tara:strand:- start:44 stop:190 length:147 start_codon:yes stop_codon:yes gene_type:complete